MTESKATQLASEVPEYLRQHQTTQDAGEMASANRSVPRISLRGRKFRLIVDGEEIKKPSDELDVVILGVSPVGGLFAKGYYAKGYQSGENAPPDCSSNDGIRPDPWITAPIAQRCQQCPKNVWGSATNDNGKKTKACKDSKHLAVALPEDVEGTVFGLKVPVTSLKAMSSYGMSIAKHGYPLAALITRLEMEDAEFPQISFSHKGFLAEKEGLTAMARQQKKDWVFEMPRNEALAHDSQASGAIEHERPTAATINKVNAEAPAGEAAPGKQPQPSTLDKW